MQGSKVSFRLIRDYLVYLVVRVFICIVQALRLQTTHSGRSGSEIHRPYGSGCPLEALSIPSILKDIFDV